MRGVRPWRSRMLRLLLAAAEGLLWVLGGGVLLALVIWQCGLPPAGALRFAAGLLWCLGALAAGRRAGLHGRRHGALEGVLCACLLLLARACGAVLLHRPPRIGLFDLLPVLLSGMLGGVLGVNTKPRKPPN